MRYDRQLRRPVGTRARQTLGCQRAALRGGTLLRRHRQDRRRHPEPAGDARSGRLHLLQGGSRRPRDGWLRARSQAVERFADSGRLRVPAAARGLGPVRDPDDQCDPSHAVSGDCADQDASQRAGELHARRELRSRRGARSARVFRVRRLQLGGDRQLRRRRPARRRVDRRRRGADRFVGRRRSPLRAVSRQSPASRRSHGRVARIALRDAMAARGARHRSAVAPLALVRPAEGEARRLRHQAQLGARELFSSGGSFTGAVHTGNARVAAVRARRTARVPRGRRGIRPDVVLQVRAQGARCAGGAAAAVRQRDRRAHREDGVHRDAEHTWRLRERPHDHASCRRHVLHPDRLGPGHARRIVDRAPRRRKRIRGPGRRHQRLLGDFVDGAEIGSAAAHTRARRSIQDRTSVLNDC